MFHLYKKKENFNDTEDLYLRKYILLFIVVVLLELSFLFYSLWCLFMLRLPFYFIFLLVMLMLIPDYGFFFSFLIVMYYHCHNRKQKQT